MTARLDLILEPLCKECPAVDPDVVRHHVRLPLGLRWDDPEESIKRLQLVTRELGALQARHRAYVTAQAILRDFQKSLPGPLPPKDEEERLLETLLAIMQSRQRALVAELDSARQRPGRKGTLRRWPANIRKWEWLGDCADELYAYLAPLIPPERGGARGLYTERVLKLIAQLLNAACDIPEPGLDAVAIKTRLQARSNRARRQNTLPS